METKTIEKVKINFNEPHVTYRLKTGEAVVGTTTALGMLNKPALPIWGFNTGKEPMYSSLPEALTANKVKAYKLKKSDAMVLAFNLGQARKYSNLYGQRDKAANIGTIAHEILKAREQGLEVDNSNIAEDDWKLALKCVESHDKWFSGMDIETILFEKELVSEVDRYGGTIDKYAYVTGEETLIDYKSGKDIYIEYFYQLTAYVNLLIENGYPVKRAIIVNMPKTKGDNFKVDSKSVESLFEAGYFDVFRGAKDVYYATKKIKKYGEVF